MNTERDFNNHTEQNSRFGDSVFDTAGQISELDNILNSYFSDGQLAGQKPVREAAEKDVPAPEAEREAAEYFAPVPEAEPEKPEHTALAPEDPFAELQNSGPDVYDGPFRTAEAAENAEEPQEEEFDPRFHTTRRRDYSYGGKRVSSSQELHYEQKQNPQYDELRSSYGANEDYDFDRQYGFTQEEEPPTAKNRLKNLFGKKKKDEPYISPVTGKEFGEDAAESLSGEEQDFEAVPPEEMEQNRKKGFALFNRKKNNPEEEDPELDEDYADSYRKEDAYLPHATFGAYLTSRIAGIALRIRGGIPAQGSMGSAYAETEFMGEEMQPLAASRYYGAHVFSLRFRTRIALVLVIFSLWLSLGAPSVGMLSNLRVATAACLAMEFTMMLLALDIVTNAVLNCFRKKFGADFLVVLSCLFSAFDALLVLNSVGVTVHMPFCSISSLTLFGLMLSSLLSARGMRKALRVPAIGMKKYAVTTEKNVTGKEITVLKSSRPLTGFVRRMEEAPLDEMVFGKFSLFLALFVLFLALLVALFKRSLDRFIYIYSLLLCTSVPFTALLGFALPYFMGSMKLFGNGAALAGWSGVCELGHSRNLIVTDTDVFPEETISMESVRVFADYDGEKVVTYAASLILESGCGLVPVFRNLMEENGYTPVRIDNLEFLSGGGIKGMAEGHVIILGGSDMMRLMNIRVPYRLVSSTSALLSIDGVLYGIFNIAYKADPRVRKALVSLMRSSRNPVFAIRDFNVTPEMIKEKFDVATDGYDFPPYADRYRISSVKPSGDSQVSGVLCREGLGPLTDLADTARKIYCVSAISVAVSALSTLVGALYAFIRVLSAGSMPIFNVLIFLLIFNVPVLILGLMTNTFE